MCWSYSSLETGATATVPSGRIFIAQKRGGGQLVLAEPIYSDAVPTIVAERNAKSILPGRLDESIPQHTEDPDEEPLNEQDLLGAIADAGFNIIVKSKGFELFHVSDPITQWERLLIRAIYWRYRNRGDVIAMLLECPHDANSS